MEVKRPKIKLTVGAAYYAFNTGTEGFAPESFDTTVKSEIIKSIGTTENAETTPIRASGKDYAQVSQTSSTELAMEVVAFHPEDLAKLRGETIDKSGAIFSGRTSDRPYIALGFPIIKQNEGVKYTWYPKCQLVENSDDTATSEESFSEQNETLTFKAFAFNEEGDIKLYVDNEATNFPVGLTEEAFFKTPIVDAEGLKKAVEESTTEGA